MFNDQNKVIARRLIEEGFNKNNTKLLDELFAADVQSHDTQSPTVRRGPDGVRQSMQTYLTAFPDSKLTIEREIADGDYVVQHLRTIGTNTGALGGIPATGKKAEVTGVITNKFKDGKIVETWSIFDQLGLLQQIGVVPVTPMPEVSKRQPELVGAGR